MSGWRRISAVAATIVALCQVARAEEAPGDSWRSAQNGGINALYCLLRFRGVPCEYAQLARENRRSAVDSAGGLVRLASAQGVLLRASSLSLDELARLSLPVIVHMDGQTPAAGAFLLVFGFSNDVIYYVNGPTASVHALGRDDFRRVWSGVALLPAEDNGWAAAGAAGLCLGLLTVALVARVRRAVQSGGGF